MKKSIFIMSKLVCFALVMVMLLVETSSIVYADTYPQASNHSVMGRRVGEDEKVYSVDVTWGKMQFIYKTVGIRKWNEKTHLFDEDLTSTWIANGNTVKLTNHSNTDVNAKFTYVSKYSKYNEVVGKFSGTTETELPSAEGKPTDDKELTTTKKLTLSGSIKDALNDYTSIGNIKIEIN